MPKQTVPLRITLVRVVLSPVFLTLFLLIENTIFNSSAFQVIGITLLWVIFTCIGVSDLLDGAIARHYQLVSNAGKVLDPLADVLSHLTYFVCLVHADILWVWLFVVIIYRELLIIGMRLLLALRGVPFPAGRGGKLKTILFTVATISGLLLFSFDVLNISLISIRSLYVITTSIFIIATVVSYISFVRYVSRVRHEKLLSR